MPIGYGDNVDPDGDNHFPTAAVGNAGTNFEVRQSSASHVASVQNSIDMFS